MGGFGSRCETGFGCGRTENAVSSELSGYIASGGRGSVDSQA
jgi:hypothetical protein